MEVKTSRHVEPDYNGGRGWGAKGAPDILDVWVRRVRSEDGEEDEFGDDDAESA